MYVYIYIYTYIYTIYNIYFYLNCSHFGPDAVSRFIVRALLACIALCMRMPPKGGRGVGRGRGRGRGRLAMSSGGIAGYFVDVAGGAVDVAGGAVDVAGGSVDVAAPGGATMPADLVTMFKRSFHEICNISITDTVDECNDTA